MKINKTLPITAPLENAMSDGYIVKSADVYDEERSSMQASINSRLLSDVANDVDIMAAVDSLHYIKKTESVVESAQYKILYDATDKRFWAAVVLSAKTVLYDNWSTRDRYMDGDTPLKDKLFMYDDHMYAWNSDKELLAQLPFAGLMAEQARIEAEKARVQTEAQREASFRAMTDNPPKVVDGNWWQYDIDTKAYKDTGVRAIVYPAGNYEEGKAYNINDCVFCPEINSSVLSLKANNTDAPYSKDSEGNIVKDEDGKVVLADSWQYNLDGTEIEKLVGKGYEQVIVSLSANQDSGVELNGIHVKVVDTSDNSIVAEGDYAGEPLSFAVKATTAYKVVVDDIDGFLNPSTEAYKAVSLNKRNLALEYKSERMFPTAVGYDGASVIGKASFVVFVPATNVRKTYTYTDGMYVDIPFGTFYQVVWNKVTDYSTPMSGSRRAAEQTYNLSATYGQSYIGVGILKTDGSVVAAADWTGEGMADVEGILCGDSSYAVVLYPESIKSWPWGASGAIEGMAYETVANNITGHLDVSLTDAYLKKYPSLTADNIFAHARSCVFQSGATASALAYDTMIMLYSNRTAVNACYKALGLSAAWDPYVWTATPYNDSQAVRLNYGGFYQRTRGNDTPAIVGRPY